MKRRMRFSGLWLAVMLFVSVVLAGCSGGGSGVRADAELEGHYIAVVGEMMGIALVGDDLSGFSFDLESGGKGKIAVDGESHGIKWQNDDSTVTITVDKTDIVGTRTTDAFTVENMLDMGMNLTFAKEGSEAAKPDAYLPEKDKFMLGDWQSDSVGDVLGNPVEGMADDALQMTFTGDYQVKVTLSGEDKGTYKWSNLSSWGNVDDESFKLSWDIQEDGLEVTYNNAEGYYVFHCPKDGASSSGAGASASGAAEAAAGGAEAAAGAAAGAAEAADGQEAETEDPIAAELAAKKDGAGESAEGSGSAGEETPDVIVTMPEVNKKAGSGPRYDYWNGDWYGFWYAESGTGDYEGFDEIAWDCCAKIEVYEDDTARIWVWDGDGSLQYPLSIVDMSLGGGLTEAGTLKSEEGKFWLEEINVHHADWMADPGASDVSDFDHMIAIEGGEYEDENGGFKYTIYLRPWGMDWSDVKAKDDWYMPANYDSWYVGIKDKKMPEKMN